jgi:hypothetical protein
MPPHGQKQKRTEDKRSSDEIAVESAKNSIYNVCTPMYKAEHIRMRNPITALDKVYSVKDPIFFEAFYELANMGLEDKLMSEIQSFITDIDSNWQPVYDTLSGYIKAKKTATE